MMRLPNGGYASSNREGLAAWDQLVEPLCTATGWEVIGFNPAYLIDTKPGSITLTVNQVKQLVAALERGKDASHE